MINILHGCAALLLGVLLELLAGNWYAVIPFSLCVLNRITVRFSLPYVFLCGFLTGLVMDLIYWRAYPGSALAAGFTVLTVRVLSDRMKIRTAFFESLFKGVITGGLAVFLMVLFNGYADSRRLPYKYHLVTSLAGGVVFQVLISPLKKEKEPPERPRSTGSRESGADSTPRKSGKGRSSGSSGRAPGNSGRSGRKR